MVGGFSYTGRPQATSYNEYALLEEAPRGRKVGGFAYAGRPQATSYSKYALL